MLYFKRELDGCFQLMPLWNQVRKGLASLGLAHTSAGIEPGYCSPLAWVAKSLSSSGRVDVTMAGSEYLVWSSWKNCEFFYYFFFLSILIHCAFWYKMYLSFECISKATREIPGPCYVYPDLVLNAELCQDWLCIKSCVLCTCKIRIFQKLIGVWWLLFVFSWLLKLH